MHMTTDGRQKAIARSDQLHGPEEKTKMTYTATVRDGGVSAHHMITADSIDAAVDALESLMRDAEEVTDGNPDCEPRTRWTAHISDGSAECSLRGESQDLATWARASIEAAE